MTAGVLQIRTPEGVVFTQVLAGPVSRFCAWFIDTLVIVTLMIVPSLLAAVFKSFSHDVAAALNLLAYFVISIGYGIACEWLWRGQTVGKKLVRLRVVDAEGLRLQFHQIVVRNLLRFIDALPLFYLVGGASCWLSRRNQRLGDLAANTVVIRMPHVAEPDVDRLLADRYNSFRQYPHLEARLRQQVTPEEAAIALQALLRRDDFDSNARIALFADLARHFSEKVAFPAESTESISDEQYLRNVVDVLYRTRGKSSRPIGPDQGSNGSIR